MKNLTLQMADVSTFKKPAEATNKSNVVSDNAVEANASFQMVLNKQVQAKHVATQEAQPKQPQPKEADVGNVNQSATQAEVVDSADTKKAVDKAHQLRLVKSAKENTKKVDDLANLLDSKSTVGVDDKVSISKITDGKADEDLAITVDNKNLADITVVNAAGIIGLSPMVAEIKSSDATKLDGKQDLVSALTTSDKQRSLGAEIKDNVLSNALSQNKVAGQTDGQVTATVDDKQSNSKWLEAMLPNASKQTATDGLANAKETLSALQENASKEQATKELGAKEISLPTNFQTTSPNSSATAIQELGRSNMINAYPGKAGWDQAISQKVVWMLGAQEQSATLTLNPPELGPLQVVINVHNDQANATFTSDNAEVRQALQDGMANLRDKMNESGIQLGQANVNSGEQMQQQFQQASRQSGLASGQRNRVEPSQVEAPRTSQRVMHEANGLVDTFA